MADKKKGPACGEAPTQNTSPDSKPLLLRSPRQVRLLAALLQHKRVHREDADRIAGSSNSPAIVATLRREYGIAIRCERECVSDRDGEVAYPGIYSLSNQSRMRARLLLHASMTFQNSRVRKLMRDGERAQ